MAKTSRPVDLEPIDRLEEKVRLMVEAIERMRTEQVRLADENQRLTQELQGARARIGEAEAAATETFSLREERDLIRSRVTEMLQQLDGLTL